VCDAFGNGGGEIIGLRWRFGSACGGVFIGPANDLEPRLTRNGYDAKNLIEQFDAKPAEIRQLFRGDLDPARTRELLDEMRAAGLPT